MHRMMTMHARPRQTDEHYANSVTIRSRMHRGLMIFLIQFVVNLEVHVYLVNTCVKLWRRVRAAADVHCWRSTLRSLLSSSLHTSRYTFRTFPRSSGQPERDQDIC